MAKVAKKQEVATVEQPTLKDLLKATAKEKPTAAARQALRDYLKEHGTEEFARAGDLARKTVEVITHEPCKNDWSLRQAIYAKVDEIRHDLGYETAPALERLIIDSIVVAWTRYYLTEGIYSMNLPGAKRHELVDWERIVNMSQRRYLRAVEMPAKVRKLNINVQVNVANNQVVANQK